MQNIQEWFDQVDKSSWGSGPWHAEPDKVVWIDDDTGYDCMALRNHHAGSWCGYVGVPRGHALYGRSYSEGENSVEVTVNVHGGVTFSNRCERGEGVMRICHDGKSHPWWFGFDTAHCFDYMPAMFAKIPGLRSIKDCEYRTLEYVCQEVKSLAAQLRALA